VNAPIPLRTAVIGCGRIARLFHLPILAGLPAVDLVALVDEDPAALRAAAAFAPTAVAAPALEPALAATEVDAAVICLPSAAHAEAAIAAFGRGLHVYVEKPLALDLESGMAVREAWRSAGTVGAVGLNYRFHAAHRKLAAAVRAGRVGTLVAVRSAIGAARRELPAWKRARESGGGALLDLLPHHADLIPFLLGRQAHAVRCDVRSVHSDQDTAHVSLRLDGGLVADCLASLTGVEEDRVEVYGDRGRLVVDRFRVPGVRHDPPRPPTGRGERAAALVRSLRLAGRRVRPAPEGSFAPALECFARTARGEDGPFQPDVEAGLRSLAVVAAAEESARSGGWVRVQPA